MSDALKVLAEPPVIDELGWFLDRARQGDDSVLPKLREILDDRPELWQHYGDLALHTKTAWINLIAGTDLVLKESVARKAEEMKAELAGPAPSPLELLLADRAVACFLQLSHADAGAAHAMASNAPKQLADFWLKRQNGAHRRFTTSIGALATLRRLLPNRSQIAPTQDNRTVQDSGATELNALARVPELRLVGGTGSQG